MSVRIKVSYTEDEELCNVLKRLSPDVRVCKIAKKQAGKYKRAFVDLGTEKPNEQRGNGGKIQSNSERTPRNWKRTKRVYIELYNINAMLFD